jgi:O-antigen/teichoic acid export membrane protein
MKIKERFYRSEFIKNTATLVTGTSIAQFIGILTYPVLSRLFIAPEFGLLSTLSQISAIIMILASGKYESSILIADSKKEAADIIGLILYRSSIILIILYVVLQLFGNILSHTLNEPNLNKWLFVCPLLAFVIIIYNCFNEWCVRHKYYGTLSWNKIINTLAHTLSKVFFGFVRIVGNGLVVGDLIGRIISAGTCVYRGLKNDKETFLQIDKKQFKPLSRKYINFPKFNMPDQLLNSFGMAMPVFLLGAFFNNAEVGYYSMTMNVLSVPISIISVAIRDVFRQKANEEYLMKGNCIDIYKKLLFLLTIVSFFVGVIAIFFLPWIFSFFLGKRWLIAGEYAQILLPMIIIDFISFSLSGVFIITNKLKESMFWQIYYFGITLISLLIGSIYFKTVQHALICFAIGRGSAYILYILLSFKFAKGEKLTSEKILK